MYKKNYLHICTVAYRSVLVFSVKIRIESVVKIYSSGYSSEHGSW